jgi:hypothetical protein
MERLILRGLLYFILVRACIAMVAPPGSPMTEHGEWYFLLALGFLACSARQVGKSPDQADESKAIQERVLKKLKEAEGVGE